MSGKMGIASLRGETARKVLELIRAAGAQGITDIELQRIAGLRTRASSFLDALDPVYEETVHEKGTRFRETRYFWCGKEGACGTECR